jgi:hypothetical protein
MNQGQKKLEVKKNDNGKKEDNRIYVDLSKEDEEDKELIDLLEGKCKI